MARSNAEAKLSQEEEALPQKVERKKRPDLSVIEGGAGEGEKEIRKREAARMAEITNILEKWRGTPIGDKAGAILTRAYAAKEDLDKALAEMKTLLPSKEQVEAQKKAAKEAAEKLQIGDSVTWMIGRTAHSGEYLGLTPTGAAKVQESGKAKVSYVPANFLKKEEPILELTEEMVEEEKPAVAGIPGEYLGDAEKAAAAKRSDEALEVVLGAKTESRYQRKKETIPTFELGEPVRWVDNGTVYFGKFDKLNPTGLARIIESKTNRPMYVLPKFLEKQADIIKRVVDFDDLISVVHELGDFPAEQGKLSSAKSLIAILEDAKSGDAFTADSPIVLAMPDVVRQKVQELLDPRFAEVKGLIADVRDWNELIQVVKDVGHFTYPDGRPFKTSDIITALQAGKLDKRLEPNSPWVLVFPEVLQAKINELLTLTELEVSEEEWEGPEIQPVAPNDWLGRKKTGELPEDKKPGELPEGRRVKGLLTGRERQPVPPVITDEVAEVVEPGALPEGQRAKGFLTGRERQPVPPPVIEDEVVVEGLPRLETLRLNFAERDAELTDKYRGYFGWIRRNLVPGGKEKYQKVMETREQAWLEYSRERALEMKDKLDAMIAEEMKLADAKAEEFIAKRHWGQKLYNWYANSAFARKMKVGRLAVGLGLIIGGVAVGPVALAAALGGSLALWKLTGIPFTGVGMYDVLRMGAEKFLSGLSKLKLDKDNQAEMDAFVRENKLGSIGLLRNREQRRMYDEKMLELKAKQVGELDKETNKPKVSDEELEKMIKWFETTVAMKGLPPSEDPVYRKLMEEKARRLREQLEEVDAGEEGNEPERAKFAEAVEARKAEKVDVHILDVYRVLRLGALAEKTKPSLQFEGLGATAQDFMKSNFNWEAFKIADKATKEAVLKKLKRKAQEFFHPDKHPEDPSAAEETLQQLVQLIGRLSEGTIEPMENAAVGDQIRNMQGKAVEKLPLSVQTILEKYGEIYGKSLPGLYAHLFTAGSVALLNVPGTELGARLEAVQLVKEIEAELRQAMMNDEAIIRDAEEEVRAEIEGVIAEVQARKEKVEARNAKLLDYLANADDGLNRQLADKAKTRKDLMKVTAALIAGILGSGIIQRMFGGETEGGKHGPPPKPPVGPELTPKPPLGPPVPIEGGPGIPRFVEDTFRPGEGVIRFAERHRDLFGGASNPDIEKWSKALLLKKGLIEIKGNMVGYKFIPHIGDTGRIVTDVAGKPIDFIFGPGVAQSSRILRWIPMPKTEYAGMSRAAIEQLTAPGAAILAGAEKAAAAVNPGAAASAVARMAETSQLRAAGVAVAADELKWFGQADQALPEAVDKLEYGL